ncbi:nuclear transport factor 2 family protein [Phenylobacterium sp.]|uniref:nuclear transport factor 2 family protein n=1 Tax=Phenylobacterium sp. TaxID=1871053 RepID=UPI00286E6F43|nr:nuclear transport factor 2 family protein [Phenylobacterium sp.]
MRGPVQAGESFSAVLEVLNGYFDGLYRSDPGLLADVFHPKAHYVCATDGDLLYRDMATYLPIVGDRPSPASLGETRRDRVLSIEFAGPVTALAKVECSIGPKHFTDFLTIIFVDGRWRIISKVFHYDLITSIIPALTLEIAEG